MRIGNVGRLRRRYQLDGFIYIAPWLLGFLLLDLYPLMASLYYSFTNFNLLDRPSFIGFKNYIDMFQRDQHFWNSVRVTLKWVIIAVPAKLVFALLVAMLLNMKLRFMNFYRTVYYLPSIFAGSVAISILWRFLFMQNGLVNQVLSIVNLGPVDWLGDPGIALYTVSLTNVWQFGASMVIFLAGLKQIPSELYDAGKIDGVGIWQKFRYITFPMLSPIILFNLIMQTINAFQEFTTPFVITNGGPVESTYLYSMMIYDNGFQFLKMGYASALSWLLFVGIMVFTWILFITSRYWTHYEDGGKR